MSDIDLEINEVRKAMSDAPLSIQVEYRVDSILRELDELCALAIAHPEAIDRIGAGQVLTRAQLLCSFLIAKDQPKFKVLGRG